MADTTSNQPPVASTPSPVVNALLGGFDPATANPFAQEYNDLYTRPDPPNFGGISHPGLLPPEVKNPEPDDFVSLLGAHASLNTILGAVVGQARTYDQYTPPYLTQTVQPGNWGGALDYVTNETNFKNLMAQPGGARVIARAMTGAYQGLNAQDFLWKASYDAAKWHYEQRIAQAGFGANLGAGLLAASPELLATFAIPIGPEGSLLKILSGATSKSIEVGELAAKAGQVGAGALKTSGTIDGVANMAMSWTKPAAGAAASGALQMGSYGLARELTYQALNDDRTAGESYARVMSDMMSGAALGVAAKAFGFLTKQLLPKAAVEQIKKETDSSTGKAMGKTELPPAPPSSEEPPSAGPGTSPKPVPSAPVGPAGGTAGDTLGPSLETPTEVSWTGNALEEALLNKMRENPDWDQKVMFIPTEPAAPAAPTAPEGAAKAPSAPVEPVVPNDFMQSIPHGIQTQNDFLDGQREFIKDVVRPLREEMHSYLSTLSEPDVSVQRLHELSGRIINRDNINPHNIIRALETLSGRVEDYVARTDDIHPRASEIFDSFRSEVAALRRSYDADVTDYYQRVNRIPTLQDAQTEIFQAGERESAQNMVDSFGPLREQADQVLMHQPEALGAMLVRSLIDSLNPEDTPLGLLQTIQEAARTLHPRDLTGADQELYVDLMEHARHLERQYRRENAETQRRLGDVNPEGFRAPEVRAAPEASPVAPETPQPVGHDAKVRAIMGEIMPEGSYRIEGDAIFVQSPGETPHMLPATVGAPIETGLSRIEGSPSQAISLPGQSGPLSTNVTRSETPLSPNQQLIYSTANTIYRESLPESLKPLLEEVKTVRKLLEETKKPAETSPDEKPVTAKEMKDTAKEVVKEAVKQAGKAAFIADLQSGLVIGSLLNPGIVLKAMGILGPGLYFATYTHQKGHTPKSVSLAADFAMYRRLLDMLPPSQDKDALVQLSESMKSGDLSNLTKFNSGVLRLYGSILAKNSIYNQNNEALVKFFGFDSAVNGLAKTLMRAMAPMDRSASQTAQQYGDMPGIDRIVNKLREIQSTIYPDKSLSYNVRYVYDKVRTSIPDAAKPAWENIYRSYFAPLGVADQRVLEGFDGRGAGENARILMDHAIELISAHLTNKPVSVGLSARMLNESVVAGISAYVNPDTPKPIYQSFDAKRDMQTLAMKDYVSQKPISIDSIPLAKGLIIVNESNRVIGLQKVVNQVYGGQQ